MSEKVKGDRAAINVESSEETIQSSSSKKEAAKQSNQGFSRLFGYTLRYKALLFWGFIGLIVSSLATLAIPYVSGQIIEQIGNDSDMSDLNYQCFQFIILTLIGAGFTLLRGSCFNILGEKVLIDVRMDIFDSFIRKDTEFYDTNKSGELLSRITSDTATLQTATSESISLFIRNMVSFLGSFILLWAISWKLTIAMLIIVPPLLYFLVYFIRQSKKQAKDYQDSLAVANSVANEVISNIRVVKSFATESKESQNFRKQMMDVYKVGRARAILQGAFMAVFTMVGFLAILGVLWYGGYLVLNTDMSLGDLTSFILYTISMSTSLLMVGGQINLVITAIGVAEKLFSMIDKEVHIQSGKVKDQSQLSGEIMFRNACFEYPTKPGVQVLKNVQIDIKKGQTVALVGSSGSGKSSIVSLLERFYDLTSGEILIDSRNIKEYDWEWLHQNIGYVSQEPTLFSNSLKENIVYGVNKYTDADIDNAMRMANAYDFVNNKEQFPEGLNTIVGERGVKLSGGQKQRVAIARALIKNPSILIFDEATSALDAESEYQVQQAIDGLVQKGNKTILIIAHRLSTIINCDKILVLDEGQIKEQGDHKTLLQMNGIYKKLIERQLSGLKNNEDNL